MSKRARDKSVDIVFSFINGDDNLVGDTVDFFRTAGLDECVLNQLEVLYRAAYVDETVDVPYFPWGLYARISEPLLNKMLADGTIDESTHIKHSLTPDGSSDGKAHSQVSRKKRVRRVGIDG